MLPHLQQHVVVHREQVHHLLGREACHREREKAESVHHKQLAEGLLEAREDRLDDAGHVARQLLGHHRQEPRLGRLAGHVEGAPVRRKIVQRPQL